jgi:signal transduction histidine kinase
MAETAKQIAAGNYTVRVPIPAENTMGQFAQVFNQKAESLQKLEQQRKTIMIDVAHELRTPLTNMRGYLEALSDKVIPPSQEMFELLQEETMRLVTLTEDLLQLARAEAARITLKRQEVSLQDLLGQSLELFHSQFLAKDITVEQTPPNEHMETRNVMADPDKLTQVLYNLLQNAWQYTPHGGTVTVGLEPRQTHVKISITNTGDGIAQDDLPYIFERFYRAEKSRSREHGGEGIGLAIVKELVEAHGGTVGAHSSQEQTRVWFTVPT